MMVRCFQVIDVTNWITGLKQERWMLNDLSTAKQCFSRCVAFVVAVVWLNLFIRVLIMDIPTQTLATRFI